MYREQERKGNSEMSEDSDVESEVEESKPDIGSTSSFVKGTCHPMICLEHRAYICSCTGVPRAGSSRPPREGNHLQPGKVRE